jgi:hypothetical protein
MEFELIDDDRKVGWISGSAVGFRGFANEVEAAHAAWVAHRTLTRRLARRMGTRPIPIDTEPLAIAQRDSQEVVLASGRPIAAVLRPAADSPSGPDSFGFEIRVPLLANEELEMPAMAYLIYRTLRKSGLRWALWKSRVPRARGHVGVMPSEPRRTDETQVALAA